MQTYRIAVYPGDGIGPEVTDQAVRVLDAAQARSGEFSLEMTHLPWGVDYWVETGRVASPDYLDILRPFDAILLGALGFPARIPDHITLEPLVRLRQSFDQYACVRPARLFPGVRSVLAHKGPGDVDLVVVRENSEGEYVPNGGRFKVGQPEEFALQTAIHTRRGIERILRFGFSLAERRRGRLTMITKSNAQKYGFVLWDEILEELRPAYSSIRSRQAARRRGGHELCPLSRAIRRGGRLQSVCGYSVRPGRHHRRGVGAGAQRQSQPRANLSFHV